MSKPASRPQSPGTEPEGTSKPDSTGRPTLLPSRDPELLAALRRRLDGTHRVDEWGLDPDLIGVLSPLLGLRWDISAQWTERIPPEGPVVLVHNRRAGVSEVPVLTRGVRLATGRYVRSAGLVDVAPVNDLGRRLGGVVDRPDELTGLLRAGEAVAVPLAREWRHRHRAGALDPAALAPALAACAAVVPVALVGRETGRRWRLLVGRPLPATAGTGPLAAAELADAARRGVQLLLDEALPPRLFRG